MKLTALIASLVGGLVNLTSVTRAVAQQTTFESLTAEGDLAFAHGKLADAERVYVKALEEMKETPENFSRQPLVLNSLANIYNLEGRYSDAKSLCQRAVTLVETSRRKTDPAFASILSTLGSVNLHLGKYARAEQSIQRAITIFKQDSRDHHIELLANYTLLGVALCSQERCKQADQLVQQAVTLCEPSRAGCQKGIAVAQATLAAIYARQGHYRQAEESYRNGLETLERAYRSSNAVLVPILSDLASLYASRNRFSEAEATGHRALEIAEKELPESDAAAKAALAMGQALAGQGRFEAANHILSRRSQFTSELKAQRAFSMRGHSSNTPDSCAKPGDHGKLRS